MSEAPRVRAVAAVGSRAPTARGEATFIPRRRHGHLGPVSIVQFVVLEAVVVLVLVLLPRGVMFLVPGVVVALAVVVVTFGRHRGRWWLERVSIRRQFRRRQTNRTIKSDDLRLSALRGLAPDLTVETVEAGGAQIGVARDGAGWYAVAAVVPPEGMRGDLRTRLPLDALARVVTEAEQPGAVVQVVTHSVTGPNVSIASNQPAAESYRELLGPFGGTLPSDQVNWVAVRVDARTAAEAALQGDDPSAEMPALLGALIRRVGKALKRAGLTHQVLDADGMLDALVRSLDLETPQSGERVRPQEGWQQWRSARLAHACYWLQSWPDLSQSAAVLDRFSRATAAMTSVSVILEPQADGIDVRCLTRVAAEPNALARCCRDLENVASQAGAKLFRLDGELAPAVYASAPSGGGAR